MTKVLLYSGGMDSWLIDKLWKPDKKIYINIHGAYSDTELTKLPKDVEILDFPLGQFEDSKTKFVPMRNLYFLMIASNYGDELCLGATAGDRGAIDKTPEFFDKAEQMLNFLSQKQSVFAGKHIKLERRFLEMSKDDMIKEYLANGGTIQEVYDGTFSCFNPQHGEPCLACKPCFRRFVTMYNNGYPYTYEQKKKMYEYIKANVLIRKNDNSGTYYADRYKEGEDCVKAVNNLIKEFEND
jgi:7-cyano-7-deazaguanine synthase in queuosine biosynthesis